MTVVVTGKTFELRDRIKSLGGRWNPESKGWEFRSLSDAHRREFASHVGVLISEKSSAIIPPHQPPRRGPVYVPRHDRKTNMFGDDPTWFNYFADQNPISYFGFSSLAAMIKRIEQTHPNIINDETNDRNGAWERGRFDWYASECMPDAIDTARKGWHEGVELAEDVRERLTGQHAKQRRRKHTVAGGSVNVGRMLAGNPAHMLARPRQPGKKIITVFVESAVAWTVDSNAIIIRAALVAAIVDILETNGYSCEIVATANSTFQGRAAWQCVTTLKAAGETLSLHDIVFALGHPSYTRRFCLAAIALDPDLADVWKHGGRPSDAFNEDHPTNANEIYIKKIEAEDRNEIDRHAPLIEQAMQVWKLVADKNLPITFDREDAA